MTAQIMRLSKILSGGQTGGDRAAFDVALVFGLPCGGWCPAGRGAEDGPITNCYPLQETKSADPVQRAARNVADADGTLTLSPPPLAGGTRLTWQLATAADKSCLVLPPAETSGISTARRTVADWLTAGTIRVLNVAGPRESECPGIYAVTRNFLCKVWG